jgi:hypothetical protein
LFDTLEAENRLLGKVIEARVARGPVLAADGLLVRQEHAQLAERREEVERDAARARASLRRWVGPAADQPLAILPQFQSMPNACGAHPEVVAWPSPLTESPRHRCGAKAAKNSGRGVSLPNVIVVCVVSVQFVVDCRSRGNAGRTRR